MAFLNGEDCWVTEQLFDFNEKSCYWGEILFF